MFRWLQNNITFFCKTHFTKQHQADIWFKKQQFLVLKGVKRKINTINESLAEYKEHYCFQIHVYILIKSNAYLPSIIDNPLNFTRKFWPCPPFFFQKSQPPLNRGLHTINTIYTNLFWGMFHTNCEAA